MDRHHEHPDNFDPLFDSWGLNKQGKERVRKVVTGFNELLLMLRENDGMHGRYRIVVATALEIACNAAKKSIARQPDNQETP